MAEGTATVPSSSIDGEYDLAELLSPWRLISPRITEIVHRRRASRTWWVDSEEGRFVAKLTFDRRCFVEPGLMVAAEVAKAGIATGPPVPTERGELCVEVDRATGAPWTLALLTRVPGEPLSSSAPGAEEIAGDLLGRVHSCLGELSHRAWVPANLLEWMTNFAEETKNDAAAAMVQAIVDRSQFVKWSVVYGDPSPEILLTADGDVGLIDWGTPSWGPQLHDVAAWLRWLGERPAARSDREVRFLESYNQHIDVARTDRDQLAAYGRCVDAFRFGTAPAPRAMP